MSEYFVLPLTLLAIAAVLVACRAVFESLLGWTRRRCCSFCGTHHSKVPKLIEGLSGYICNYCVKTCSDVLMKECAEYRESFRNPEPNAATNGGPSLLPDNSSATKGS